MEAFAQIPISGVFLGDDFVPEREADEEEVDLDDGFVPDLYDDWKDEEIVHAKTLPMTFGVRARRSHHRG